jgi:hypothetical protein
MNQESITLPDPKTQISDYVDYVEKYILGKIRLGDKVAAVTSALGIKPCDGCKERQAILNGNPINK